MCHLQYAIVDLVVVGRESRDEIRYEGSPTLPEVRVCDDADRFTKLRLDGSRANDHEPNKLLLYRVDLLDGQFVVPVLVLGRSPVSSVLDRKKVYEKHRLSHTT